MTSAFQQPDAQSALDAIRPVSVDLDRRRTLRIGWADGHLCELSLSLLRRACPCATCRQEREAREKNPLHVMRAGEPDSAMAEEASLVGNYALRLRWAGGHDTGIYEWSYLRSLCVCSARVS
ncbi:MAG: DUF971 domain-containing protein [Phycisphaerales bacterium]|nr:DUF971 domain-containing protein [Phycisphaerales bacterium]